MVFSPAHNDPPELARYHLPEEEEKRIRKAFVKPDDLPKILIVTEKLLTGYDAPVLYCMYLDKPMRDHVLLQDIARVNRPYENENGKHKPGGFVLDFVGIFENPEKALAFDSRDVQSVSVIEDLDVLRERFAAMMRTARGGYLPLLAGKSEDKAAEAALLHFRDDEPRHEFYRFYAELEDLYEIVSPDAFIRPYQEDYNGVADLYALLPNAYEGGGFIDRELARKTARLVQDHTQTGVIRESAEVYEINASTLTRIAEGEQPDAVKVFNLLKSIEKKVADEMARAPYLMSIGERASQIAEAFRQRQKDTQEALRALKELVNEINEAQQEQAQQDISAEAFAVFWLLKRSGVTDAQAVAQEMATTFEEFPHWRTSAHQDREVLRALYHHLERAGAEDVPGWRSES